MNCDVLCRRLLSLERPDDVPPEFAGHLAACAACRAWHARLCRMERLAVDLPVPAPARRAAKRQREKLPEDLPDREQGPAERAEHSEERALLAEAVTRLPADFRVAFLLRVEEGLSFRQIANVLGLTEETARWRVFKARQKLLRVLTPPLEQEKP